MDIRDLINDTEGRPSYPKDTMLVANNGGDNTTPITLPEYSLSISATTKYTPESPEERMAFQRGGIERYTSSINLVKTLNGEDTVVSQIPLKITNEAEYCTNKPLDVQVDNGTLVMYTGRPDLVGSYNRSSSVTSSLVVIRVKQITLLSDSSQVYNFQRPLVFTAHVSDSDVISSTGVSRQYELENFAEICIGEIAEGSSTAGVTLHPQFGRTFMLDLSLATNADSFEDAISQAITKSNERFPLDKDGRQYKVTSCDVQEIIGVPINPNVRV